MCLVAKINLNINEMKMKMACFEQSLKGIRSTLLQFVQFQIKNKSVCLVTLVFFSLNFTRLCGNEQMT